jgi:hypothetical protein
LLVTGYALTNELTLLALPTLLFLPTSLIG